MGYRDSLGVLRETKYDIKKAIYEKGVEVEGGLVTYADAIRNIKISNVDYWKVYKGVKFSGSTLSQFPKLVFEKGYVDASDLFSLCDNITTIPQIDMTKFTDTSSMFFGCEKLKYVPPINLPNVTRCRSMFEICWGLEDVQDIEMINSIDAYRMFNQSYLPKINKLILPKAETVEQIFSYCKKLVEVGELDISGAKDCVGMFEYCHNLVTLPQIDLRSCWNLKWAFDECSKMESFNLINTGEVRIWAGTFRSCRSLKHGPELDTSSAQTVTQMFSGCTSLESLPLYDFGNVGVSSIGDVIGITGVMKWFLSDTPNLTHLGGFKNLKVNWTGDGSLRDCPNLTVDSLMNVINNLYDWKKDGAYRNPSIELGEVNLNKLTADQVKVATDKNWIVY